VVIVQRERADVVLTFFDLITPFDQELERLLVAKVAGRMEPE
jgi:hypothetical protein